MNKNGLKLSTIATKAEYFHSINEPSKLIGEKIKNESDVVAYLDYKVLFGTYKDGILYFYNNEKIEDKFIQKIRLFNDKEELFIWRTSDGFNGRIRMDEGGLESEVVDAEQILFGTKSDDLGDFTVLTEKRGTEIILPGNYHVDENKKRVAIKTRNYVEYNEVNQATYTDCRFISFVQI